MKKTVRLLLPLILSVIVMNAQNLPGDWQGPLKVGAQELRIVIKISMQDDKLGAILYSIDQGGASIPASSVTRSGSTVKITFSAAGVSYEGKLSADGNSMPGTFSQAGQSFPLNLVRATPATAWAIPEPVPPPKNMDPQAKPQFEVATIKPSKPEERLAMIVNRTGMLNTTASSLSDLIKLAYDLNPRQITNAPVWYELEKYDVSAKPDTAGVPSMNQLKAMVQQLLAERFALKFHIEKRTMSVYAIAVAKSGAKIAKSAGDPNGLPALGGGPQGIGVRNATMAEFAAFLQQQLLELPVVDQTGFGTARYDFTLRFTPDAAQRRLLLPEGAAAASPSVSDPDAPPDFFTAVQQQLGLRLETTKAPVDTMIIDRVEKPSAN